MTCHRPRRLARPARAVKQWGLSWSASVRHLFGCVADAALRLARIDLDVHDLLLSKTRGLYG